MRTSLPHLVARAFFVRVTLPWPTAADLEAWGRAPIGWYGLIFWHQHGVHPNGYQAELTHHAWVPASMLSPFNDGVAGHSTGVTRIQLDGHTWPQPTRNRDCGHFHGLVTSGPLSRDVPGWTFPNYARYPPPIGG